MSFSITFKLNKRDYFYAIITGLYRRPATIILSILGLAYLISAILDMSGTTGLWGDSLALMAGLGLFFLFAPWLTALLMLKQINSNPSMQSDITYTFNEYGYTAEGLTFKAEYSWLHITKQKEIGKFLVFYHSKKAGNFIEKSKLTNEQMVLIKAWSNKERW